MAIRRNIQQRLIFFCQLLALQSALFPIIAHKKILAVSGGFFLVISRFFAVGQHKRCRFIRLCRQIIAVRQPGLCLLQQIEHDFIIRFIGSQGPELALQLINQLRQFRDFRIETKFHSGESCSHKSSPQMLGLLEQDFIQQGMGFLIIPCVKGRFRHNRCPIHAFRIQLPKFPRTGPHPLWVPFTGKFIRQIKPI